MITQERLKSILHYDAITGDFKFKIKRGSIMPGTIASSTDTKGYVTIGIDYVSYYAHRLAFLYMLGYMPKYVDHRNRIKNDNRWVNLREVTAHQNSLNQDCKVGKHGYKYVFKQSTSKTYGYQFRILGRRYYESGFETAREAGESALKAHQEAVELIYSDESKEDV